MTDKNVQKIVERAIEQGLLSPADVKKAKAQITHAETAGPVSSKWGFLIEALVKMGKIKVAVIEKLAEEIAREEQEPDHEKQPQREKEEPITRPAAALVTSPVADGITKLQDKYEQETLETVPVREWDRYEIADFLGEGGMGRVYKAFDPVLKRYVAIKFIRGEDPALARRFLREAQAQASIDHENVCKVFEVGEIEDKLYIAMQYIDGFTLRDIPPEITLEQKVLLMKEVAEGIQAAHKLGIIHRDIKPGNVIVEVTDEGILHREPYLERRGICHRNKFMVKASTWTGVVTFTVLVRPCTKFLLESLRLKVRVV
jgi:hypothetical protein